MITHGVARVPDRRATRWTLRSNAVAILAGMVRTLSADVFDLLSNPRCPGPVKVAAELIRPGDPIEIDEHAARQVLAPLLWMVTRTGSDGLALTKAGHLRPVDVNALMTELGWSNWWIGKANREELTPPAAMLRRAAVASRLVRSYKGALVLTPAGRRLHDDPVALWFHVAGALPVEKHRGQRTAAVLGILAALAESGHDHHDDTLCSPISAPLDTAQAMASLGWANRDGQPLDSFDIYASWPKTGDVLASMGIEPYGDAMASADDRAAFLRSVLTQPVPTDASTLTKATQRPRRCHTLTVTLDDVIPTVWRQIVVPSTVTLLQLHNAIQAATEWTCSHLFVFELGEHRYGYPDPDWDLMQDAARITLDKALPTPGDQAKYKYDFGDGWSHTLTVDTINQTGEYPTVLAGANACPPEDCGGPHGYEDLLAAQADPSHPRHDELREWLGHTFNPTEFNRAEANNALRNEVRRR